MKKGSTDPGSVANKVLSAIRKQGRGWVFTPAHFKGLGSRAALESALRRHKNNGTIRQVARGLYDYPRQDPQLGTLSPTVDMVAAALARRDAVRLQPSGAYAANLLGLTDQVPMRVVFLTDGPSRTVRIGKLDIILRRTTPRNFATAGRISGTVIQALRWLGQRHVDDQVVAKLKKQLDSAAKKQLMKDIEYAPIWIAEIIMDIANDNESAS